jgi:curved DNA-binding protein CbpA
MQTPPRTAKPTLEQRRALLHERLAVIETGDLFAILGVSTTASPQEAQAAFMQAAKLFHPDKLTPDCAELRPLTERVFAAIADAHRILSDPERRKAWEKGGGAKKREEQDKVQQALAAASHYEKAEHYLKRGENAEALKHARLAAEGDPERGEYLALHGWLESMGPEKDAPLAGLARIDRSLRLDPNADRALYYRGAILKRLGRVDEAAQAFRRAVTANPQNVDAAREVRLHEMRSDGGGGLLSRWFGKK